jgi:hypothetical protein
MKLFTATLRSLTSYSQGRPHGLPKLPQELEQAYEERTVLAKLHTAVNEVFIPPMALKYCLTEGARYSADQIPGRGKERYTKHYIRGVICSEPIMLGITTEQVRIEKIFTWSQPSARTGRVWKWFPVIDRWEGTLQILAVDDILTPDVIKRHLTIAGTCIGIGVWRPENGGLWGKFQVLSVDEIAVTLPAVA